MRGCEPVQPVLQSSAASYRVTPSLAAVMEGGVRNMFEQLPDSPDDDESYISSKKQAAAAKQRRQQRSHSSSASRDNDQWRGSDVPAVQNAAQGRLASDSTAGNHLQQSAAAK